MGVAPSRSGTSTAIALLHDKEKRLAQIVEQIQSRHVEYDEISIMDQPALNMARTELVRLTHVKSNLQAAINNANLFITATAKIRQPANAWFSWMTNEEEDETINAI